MSDNWEMREAYRLTDMGLAAWLWGFMATFVPAGPWEYQDDDEEHEAKEQHEAALAMLARLAGFDEIEGVLTDDMRTAMDKCWGDKNLLYAAARTTKGMGQQNAEAFARKLVEDLTIEQAQALARQEARIANGELRKITMPEGKDDVIVSGDDPRTDDEIRAALKEMGY